MAFVIDAPLWTRAHLFATARCRWPTRSIGRSDDRSYLAGLLITTTHSLARATFPPAEVADALPPGPGLIEVATPPGPAVVDPLSALALGPTVEASYGRVAFPVATV